MLDAMYDLPDKKENISKCIITKECIETKQPTIIKKRQKERILSLLLKPALEQVKDSFC